MAHGSASRARSDRTRAVPRSSPRVARARGLLSSCRDESARIPPQSASYPRDSSSDLGPLSHRCGWLVPPTRPPPLPLIPSSLLPTVKVRESGMMGLVPENFLGPPPSRGMDPHEVEVSEHTHARHTHAGHVYVGHVYTPSRCMHARTAHGLARCARTRARAHTHSLVAVHALPSSIALATPSTYALSPAHPLCRPPSRPNLPAQSPRPISPPKPSARGRAQGGAAG